MSDTSPIDVPEDEITETEGVDDQDAGPASVPAGASGTEGADDDAQLGSAESESTS